MDILFILLNKLRLFLIYSGTAYFNTLIFSDRYGLHQLLVDYKAKNPSKEQLEQVVDFALRENCRVIFSQIDYNKRIAKGIAKAIDGVVVEFDPYKKEYSDNMLLLSEKLNKALQNY